MFDLTLPARTPLPQPPFLPTTRAEMDAIGWDSLDILLVTGDAYVDHPSFGVPLLGRWLVGHGYRVGIVAQPRWKDGGQGIADLARLGRAFGIHLILATQRPDATIIPGQIRNNMDFRVCGRADNVLSQIILDNTSAAEQIPKDARGRFTTGDGTVFQGDLFDEGQP